ncbi:MAG: glycosyltransferase family 39 protein [Tepidisphaeraceae bacterium]
MSTETLPELNLAKKTVATARPAGKWPMEATITAWVVLAVGAFFRIRAWAHWRSLWLDEIYLAHSVVTRGFYRLLFEPLDKWQGAPPLYLVLTRLCVDLFGPAERGMRLPSLVAGVASLPLFFFLARRVLTLRGTLLAVLLFSCLAPLVYFSEEVKQYSTDLAVGLGILLAASRLLEEPGSRKKFFTWAIVGCVGIFFSFPAILVLAAATVVLLLSAAAKAKKEKTAWFASLAPLFAAAVVFAGLEWVNAHVFLRGLMHGQEHDGLMRDWIAKGGFPPYAPNEAAPWTWMALHNLFSSFETMFLYNAADLGMFLAIVGGGALLVGKRRFEGMLIVSPIVVALIAAFMRKYPLADRLALYLVPMLVLLIAQGIDAIWGASGMGRMTVGLLATCMVVAGPAMRSGYDSRYPLGREETKEVYMNIRRNWRAGDVILLSHMAAPSFEYYAPKTGLEGLDELWESPPGPQGTQDSAPLETSAQGIATEPWYDKAYGHTNKPETPQSGYVIVQPDYSTNPALYLDELDHLFHPLPQWRWPPVKRVWVVFAHDWDDPVQKICLPELDRLAEQKFQHQETGAVVYLYEMSGTPSAYTRE